MDALELGRQMLEYCRKYKIPQDYVMDILNDQKVVPMIRGKATEYAVELLLRDILPARELRASGWWQSSTSTPKAVLTTRT